MAKSEAENRTVVITYKASDRYAGPHWVLKFKQGTKKMHQRRRNSLARLADVVHNWIHNGEAVADESGPATPVDSAQTVVRPTVDTEAAPVLPATDDPESDLGDF